MKPEAMPQTDQHAETHPSFEELNALRAIAWESFAQRREFEWRVALGLWTALAAFASLILGKEVQLYGIAPLVCVGVVSIVLFSMHVFFVIGIARGNKVDRVIAYHYEEEMRRVSNAGLPKALQDRARAHRRQVGLRSYAHVFQLGVTLVLGLAAVLAILWKSLQIPNMG